MERQEPGPTGEEIRAFIKAAHSPPITLNGWLKRMPPRVRLATDNAAAILYAFSAGLSLGIGSWAMFAFNVAGIALMVLLHMWALPA